MRASSGSKRRPASRSPSPTPREGAAAVTVRRATGSAQREKESEKLRGKSASRKRSPSARGGGSAQRKQKGRPNRGTAARPISPARGAAGGGNKGVGSAGRPKGGVSRVTVDVSVARLQKWFRVLILRGVIKRRGLLAERISDSLHVQQRLWELRVRRAKRLLSEAFNACALRLRGGLETTDTKGNEPAVNLVNAFIRAKRDILWRTQQLQRSWQQAVRVIERAWIKSAFFCHIQQIYLERKRQRLVIQQEAIERRDYIRQRLLFLVECHQRCYNHPLLLEAGAAVRKLEWWERVVMESSGSCTERNFSAAALNDEALGEVSPVPERKTSIVVPSSHPRTSSLVTAPRYFVCPDASQNVCWANAGKEEEPIAPTTHAPSTKHRFYVRADTAFVNGLLQEMGQLAFPTSMGLRPKALVSTRNSLDNVVATACTARVQNTEHASELVDGQLVWVGGSLLRACLQPLPLFQELCLWFRSRELAERKKGQTASSWCAAGDAVSASFIHPVPRKRGREKNLAPMDLSVSVSSMGKAWADFYLFLDLTADGLSSASCSTSTSAACSLPSQAPYRRSRGYFYSRSRGRVSLDTLVAAREASEAPVSRKSSTPTPPCTGEAPAILSSKKFLGSEFDVKYEIERLFVRECHRRAKLQDEYNAEVVALGWIIHREQLTTVNAGGAKMTDKKQSFQKADASRS
ncbi:uncharacterized protein Tco025E_06917 [Trypanosoma conorhini]|uniref:Uncharacterized protein n=1 Tax=Trypanosoma conorhini TaxID=83891 RepID=A0A422NXF2_9TRYP|nr:uncharacterized protein Tco025E_06917 [Trypanosoma conorhini]RNF10193.1 hypothetical protein Tco025E_06917 [Trypanosoma conorhini]